MNSDLFRYDVIVIGAGPGGYVCAIRAAQLGLKTAIVDKQWLGGVCLNVGCIPSKALLRSAEVAELLRLRGQEFGFSFDNLRLDYGAAVRRSRRIADGRVKGVGLLMRQHGIAVHLGTATLQSPTRVGVTDQTGAAQVLEARNIVLATGARPAPPAAFNVDGRQVLTYREAIVQEHLPQSVVIIGAGAIGVEFGTLWHAYGTQVTLVEMQPNVLPGEDSEISAELARQLRRAGMRVLTGAGVEAIEPAGSAVKVKIGGPAAPQTLEAEQALVAIGFRPNSEGLGLAALGVQTERGYIQVDERLRTNVPGIWAIGDVTGKKGLAHVASAQAIVCAESIAGLQPAPLDYLVMPNAIYGRPQVASFGLTEAQAREQGRLIKVARVPFQINGKAQGLGDYAGFVKLVTGAKYGELLGAHLIGPEVTELLPELTLAYQAELSVEEIARNVHAHPTLSEALMEAAHGLVGGTINI